MQLDEIRWQNEALSTHLEEAQQQLVLQAAAAERAVTEARQAEAEHAQALLQLSSEAKQQVQRQAAMALDRATEFEQAQESQGDAEGAVRVAQLREATAVHRQVLQEGAMDEAVNRAANAALNADAVKAYFEEQLVLREAKHGQQLVMIEERQAEALKLAEERSFQEAAAAAIKLSLLDRELLEAALKHETALEKQAAVHAVAVEDARDQTLLEARRVHKTELQTAHDEVLAVVAEKESVVAELKQTAELVLRAEAQAASVVQELTAVRELHVALLTEAKDEATDAAAAFGAQVDAMKADRARCLREATEQSNTDALDAQLFAVKAMQEVREEGSAKLAEATDKAHAELAASESKRAELCAVLMETKMELQDTTAMLQEARDHTQELQHEVQELQQQQLRLQQQVQELHEAAEQRSIDQVAAALVTASEGAKILQAAEAAEEVNKQVEQLKAEHKHALSVAKAEADAAKAQLAEVQAMRAMDINNDGVVSQPEFISAGGTKQQFDGHDLNGDGVLDGHELADAEAEAAEEVNKQVDKLQTLQAAQPQPAANMGPTLDRLDTQVKLQTEQPLPSHAPVSTTSMSKGGQPPCTNQISNNVSGLAEADEYSNRR